MTTYFDVTDIIQYAKGNSRVSGIQRVQLRIVAELTRPGTRHDVGIVYFDEDKKQHLRFDPNQVFDPKDNGFNPKHVLQSLGITTPGLTPEKYQIRRFLKPYDHNKLLRGLVKAKLHMLALLAPNRLLAMGFHEWRVLDATIPKATATPIQLHKEDKLAFLGAFWAFDEVIKLAQEHRDKGGRVAILVHDVIAHVAPQYCSEGQLQQFWPRFSQASKFANRFLAVSAHTARDFASSFDAHAPTSKVTVTRLAHEFSNLPRVTPSTPPAPALQHACKPFVLCLGTIEVRKNGTLLLKAWQRLHTRLGDKTPDLLFCGKYGWKTGEFKSILASSNILRQKVQVVNSPSDPELADLIRHSLFTVFPSHYEGWGLPVGEAAWLGKLTVASDQSAIPEVLGDLVRYASPSNVDAWVAQLAELIENPSTVQQLEQRIQSAPLRSWADAAQDMLQAINADD